LSGLRSQSCIFEATPTACVLRAPGAANGCTYLMMKSWVLMGPRLTLEGAASYK
jgi:hypothetical protein